ncbi:CxxxxCH/CxxCH domain c-type cytochrome [Geothermobacter hydrogeniphilus]|uniref:CxxxxCH/CxxCH domain c-type cytochrome n=1 Tax=Geothermobacter hydrogeniphilus TaxID=1969733 RepID=UPI001304AE89|nr:hypothetical protein [Geothermobacter hydrogeniphilus]
MKRFLSILFAISLLGALLYGCSSSSSDAPRIGTAHPEGWVTLHASDARAEQKSCKSCHGLDLAGSGNAVSCFSCHLDGLPVRLHPVSWEDATGSIVPGHKVWPDSFSWTSCAVAACHGADLQGGVAAPSCLACHPDPSSMAPHALPFTDPVDHGTPAKSGQNYCLHCHGTPPNNVDGGMTTSAAIWGNNFSVNGNCSNCHKHAGAHPTNWQGDNDNGTGTDVQDPAYDSSHRGIEQTTQNTSCALCHKVNGPGSGPVPAAPSCFSSEHDNANGTRINGNIPACHSSGPRTANHPLGTDWRAASGHGKQAKADLTKCQQCHADKPAGGPGSNPRFDVALGNLTNGCETCHAFQTAHPVDWAGPNNTFHYSAGNIQKACTLCHGVALDGVGGAPTAISCKDCHAETVAFTLDCTKCHGFPPDGTGDIEVVIEGGQPVDHKNVSVVASHDTCATCHGVKQTGTGSSGELNPSANYAAFDKTTDTIGDHWNGQINMNGPSVNDPSNTSGQNVGAGYDPATFGCDAACHSTGPNDAAHQLSDSLLPVKFGDFGTGAPHVVGDSWLTLSAHATQAVAGSLDCVGCHTQTGGGVNPPCQGCHQVAPKMDLTQAGCSSCHSVPPDGATPVATAPNRAGKHATHDGFTTETADCSACHEGGGSDSLSHYDRTDQTTPNLPADISFPAAYNAKSGAAGYDTASQTCSAVICHGGQTTPDWASGSLPTTDPATSNAYCQACHVAGTGQYNGYSSGQHDRHVNSENRKCVECHDQTILQSGVGGTGPTHWSDLSTSVFELDPAKTIESSVNYDGTSCNPSCHGSETW